MCLLKISRYIQSLLITNYFYTNRYLYSKILYLIYLFSMSECLAEKRRVSPYNAIWWCRQQTLRKLMKNMTRKSWIFWNWQSLPELSDLEKSDLKIRSRSVKKRSTIRSRSWSRKMVESDLRSDQKVICRSRSWSVDQDRHYFAPFVMCFKILNYGMLFPNTKFGVSCIPTRG